MEEQKLSISKLISEIRQILRTILECENSGSPVLLTELKENFEGKTHIELKELLSFLERYGYIILNRSNNELYTTKDGKYVAGGDKTSILTDHILKSFKDQVQTTMRARKDKEKLIDGRYRRYGMLGSGGLGTVYKGEIAVLNKEIAIKEFKEVFIYFTDIQKKVIIERLEEVVKRWAKLQHPNIVQVIDLNINSERPYFVMEYIHGGNLRRLLNQEKNIPPSTIISYLLQILYGLRLSHELGILHKNIKPENILIDLHGNIKLSDFSLNSIVERDATTIRQVFIGMGNVAYLSPEYFQDPRTVDERSDIYSLGILLYELCTKRIPGRRSPMPSEKNREIPKGLDEIFDRMTQDSPEDRYQSVNEIIEDIYKKEDIVSLIDKKSAILMYKSPFWELGLPISIEPKETKEEEIEEEILEEKKEEEKPKEEKKRVEREEEKKVEKEEKREEKKVEEREEKEEEKKEEEEMEITDKEERSDLIPEDFQELEGEKAGYEMIEETLDTSFDEITRVESSPQVTETKEEQKSTFKYTKEEVTPSQKTTRPFSTEGFFSKVRKSISQKSQKK